MNHAQLLFPDFALILCGFLLCRFTALDRKVWEPVEALVYYFLFPVLLFQAIVRHPLDLGAASHLMGAGVTLGLCGIALAYSLPYWPWLGRRLDTRLHAASAQVGFRFNSFIALALADRLAGAQGVQMIAVIIGVCVPLFNVAAVWPMARHAGRGFVRELLRNPLIIGTTSGLLFNLLGGYVPLGDAVIGAMAGYAGHGARLRATLGEYLLPIQRVGIAQQQHQRRAHVGRQPDRAGRQRKVPHLLDAQHHQR